MSSNDEFQKEIKKRLLDIEKLSKEIFQQIELLKLLLKDVSTSKDSEIVSVETPKEIEQKDSVDCLHYFGYLRFLSANESIPDECLSCQKLIECLKHVD
jgi:hypothetical protein